MPSLVRLTDLTPDEVVEIFDRARALGETPGQELAGRAVALFFPPTSLRTRVTFERAVHLGGGQALLFPPEALDKAEDLHDVGRYLSNWVDGVVVRHPRIEVLDRLAGAIPVVNAMTDVNHPCEVLADLYGISLRRPDWRRLRYVFVGADENVGRAWAEARDLLGLDLVQACPPGFELDGVPAVHTLAEGLDGADVVLTDGTGHLGDVFEPFRVSAAALRGCAPGVLLNPCPPFTRGAEVSADAIESPAFVGHEFKRVLLEVQRAVLARI
ncbi:Ornithine carbamoyltransferase [Paraoerskovia marina]|uniref:Ornithine carbamoyltransferase n=1 Tax=Paraoerskovia marina TaxID=545619 RepID=A0A1H1MVX7_9CELL|nr:hypothetical protein [Paraoerskovia marina]SDR90615.1 Ornithine carbamoyltransferase [Paraoerskovia marina]